MSNTRQRTGRPRKAPAALRMERLSGIRLTVTERHHVEEHAAQRGMSLMEFCRRAILDLPMPDRPLSVVRQQDDSRALAELNRIGVNLNQIAFAANTGRLLEGKLDEALAELHSVMERLAEGLE